MEVVGGVYDLAFEYAVGADPVMECSDAEVEDCLQVRLLKRGFRREDSACGSQALLGVQW